jgi:hypothetical protein
VSPRREKAMSAMLLTLIGLSSLVVVALDCRPCVLNGVP